MAAANQVKFQGFQFPTTSVLDKVFGVLTPQLSLTRILPLLTIISLLTLFTFFPGVYAAGTSDKEKKHELASDFARFTDNLKENRFLLNQNVRLIF
jgi:hypothetical protein